MKERIYKSLIMAFIGAPIMIACALVSPILAFIYPEKIKIKGDSKDEYL